MEELDQIRRTFFEECAELLASLEDRLNGVAAGNDGAVDAVFRAVHSIKGGAAAFGLTRLSSFAHAFETALAPLRAGEIGDLAKAVAVLLDARDVLADLAAFAEHESDQPAEREEEVKHALADLTLPPPTDDFDIPFTPVRVTFDDTGNILDNPAADRTPTQTDPAPVAVSSAPIPSAPAEPSFTPVATAPLAAKADPAPKAANLSVRVDLNRMDRLVNRVGELVITQAMLAQVGSDMGAAGNSPLMRGIEDLRHHTRDLQDGVMNLRAQAVRAVFQKVPRLVRELAREFGKDIRVVTEGEATEVDRTVIETLSDPLTHLIRNACDHGIEPPDERLRAGKPATGTIRLTAEQRGGRVCIEIADDGRGIDRSRVLEKARSRGLVTAGAPPTGAELDGLIFLPGFSTADKVTAVSGRGVGLDVVRRNVQSLGGRISVSSEQGHGTVFMFSLPLTLAVQDGMLLRVGREIYVMPILPIVECLRPAPRQVRSLPGGREVFAWRGGHMPLLRLHHLFGIPGAMTEPETAVAVVVDGEDGVRRALLADELLGEQPVVVKSIEENYRRVLGLSAATILGDGQIAFIIDIGGVVALSEAAVGQGGQSAVEVV